MSRTSSDTPDVLMVTVDYRTSAFGGWTASIASEDIEPRAIQAADAHQALHEVLAVLEDLMHETHQPIGAVHSLDGDVEAWATLAAANGFGDCAADDGHHAGYLG